MNAHDENMEITPEEKIKVIISRITNEHNGTFDIKKLAAVLLELMEKK